MTGIKTDEGKDFGTSFGSGQPAISRRFSTRLNTKRSGAANSVGPHHKRHRENALPGQNLNVERKYPHENHIQCRQPNYQ